MDISNNSQRRTPIFGILIVLMLVVLGVFGYVLVRRNQSPQSHTFGQSAPSAITPDTRTTLQSNEFDDGLGMPGSIQTYELDEFGAGISQRAVFSHDIDGDGTPDRITRTRIDNGTDHFYYEYKIERNAAGAMLNITPAGLRTTEGAECSLTKIRFELRPRFRIIKISRPWQDTWTKPTTAVKTEYRISDGTVHEAAHKTLSAVCDVSELF